MAVLRRIAPRFHLREFVFDFVFKIVRMIAFNT